MKLAMRMTRAIGRQPRGTSIGVHANSVQLTWKGSYIPFYFIVCSVYTRKFCDKKNTDLDILADIHIFCTPEYEKKWFEECRLYG
jgi:hypothetical protein